MVQALDDARAKVARAEKHLRVTDRIEAAWRNGQPGDGEPVELEHKKEGPGRHFWYPRLVREPPARVGLIIGDFAHNLRSALDYLVWGLKGHNSGNQVGFPIVSQAKDWPGQAKQKLDGINPDWIDLIKSLQPFDDERNKPFSALALLNNADKHKALIPTVVSHLEWNGTVRLTDPLPPGVMVEPILGSPYAVKPGDPLFGVVFHIPNGVTVPGTFDVDFEIDFKLSLHLDDPRADGMNFHLWDAVDATKRAIATLESALLAEAE